jgi:hypothetical protein
VTNVLVFLNTAIALGLTLKVLTGSPNPEFDIVMASLNAGSVAVNFRLVIERRR